VFDMCCMIMRIARSNRPIIMKLAMFVLACGFGAIIVPASAGVAQYSGKHERAVVRSIMSTLDDKVDFARAKLTFDKLYDPTTDIDGAMRQIDGIVETVRAMAGPAATAQQRLIALRVYIYKAGPWNQNNPFTYDFADPLGRKSHNKLLATYLHTRRGNCVSMPMLFAVLAQRLGLNVTLSMAPNHVFVKYHDDVLGRWINLEPTSGANPARDVWLRHLMPMTDAAIANGLYMKTLSRTEALVVLARRASGAPWPRLCARLEAQRQSRQGGSRKGCLRRSEIARCRMRPLGAACQARKNNPRK